MLEYILIMHDHATHTHIDYLTHAHIFMAEIISPEEFHHLNLMAPDQ